MPMNGYFTLLLIVLALIGVDTVLWLRLRRTRGSGSKDDSR